MAIIADPKLLPELQICDWPTWGVHR